MTLIETIQSVIVNLRFNLSSLEGEAQAEAVRTMERLTYFLWLLETGAPEGQIREHLLALEVRR